jgi:hypothetical protein
MTDCHVDTVSSTQGSIVPPPVPNEPVQVAEELTADVASFMSDTSEADSLMQSAGAAFPSVSGRASRKTHFCRTPIGANPNFRRIAMG